MIAGKDLLMEGFSGKSHYRVLQRSTWQNKDRYVCFLGRA